MKHVINILDGTTTEQPLTQAELDQKAIDEQAAADALVIEQAEETRIGTFSSDVDAADLLNRLKTVSATQIDTYVDNNVSFSNVAQAQATLRAITKRQLKIMALLARNI
jgi:hypothetical protein